MVAVGFRVFRILVTTDCDAVGELFSSLLDGLLMNPRVCIQR